MVLGMETVSENRNTKLNIRLSERERKAIEAEAKAREIENISVWTRKTLLNHVANFGRSSDWFIHEDTTVIGKSEKYGGTYVSDGRAMYRLASTEAATILPELLPGGVSQDIVDDHSFVRLVRDADRAETVHPGETNMDSIVESVVDPKPATLRQHNAMPVLVEDAQGRLMNLFDCEGTEQVFHFQHRYIRLIRRFCSSDVSYVIGDMPSPMLAYDAKQKLVAAIMPVTL